MKDVAKGRNLRKSVEKQEKQGALELLNKVITQMGSSCGKFLADEKW